MANRFSAPAVLMSAIMMGFGMVIFESLFSSVTLKRPLETPLLAKLSGVIPKLLIAFLIIRFGDLSGKATLV